MEQGYEEKKLARIFAASALKSSVVEQWGGYINMSTYAAHVGPAAEFSPEFTAYLDQYKALVADVLRVHSRY